MAEQDLEKARLDDFSSALLLRWSTNNPPTGTQEKFFTPLTAIRAFILNSTLAETIDNELLLAELKNLGYATEIMGDVLHLVHY